MGSVTRLSGHRRNPWCVRVSVRDAQGNVRQKMIGCYATAREAQTALDEHNRLQAQGHAPTAERWAMTVGQCWEAWWAHEEPLASKSRRKMLLSTWNIRVSALADRRIRDVGVDDWQRIIDTAAAGGLCSSGLSHCKMLISALSRYALERDIIVRDYSQFVKIPSAAPKQERRAFTAAELQRIRERAPAGLEESLPLILCYTGFRAEELLQLTQEQYHTDAAGAWFTGGLKTDAGKNRWVPVHPRIAGYVTAWQQQGHTSLSGEICII